MTVYFTRVLPDGGIIGGPMCEGSPIATIEGDLLKVLDPKKGEVVIATRTESGKWRIAGSGEEYERVAIHRHDQTDGTFQWLQPGSIKV